jgi:acetyl esterase/lipase
METITLLIQVIAAVVGSLLACWSIPLFLRLRWPSPVLWFVKLYSSALSGWFVLIAVLVTITGVTTNAVFISLIGLYDVVIFSTHVFRVTRPPATQTGFGKAFGQQWESWMTETQKEYMVPHRMVFKVPSVRTPRFEKDICFATIPSSGRQLVCDIWQPPATVPPSGIALIYLHGSAFYFLDKDFSTRPFFRQLAAQGHFLMDVAYRLAPETGIMGMLHDVNRAICWMKENAARYNVDPGGIVLGGGSAGAHLALLAAYTAGDPRFTLTGMEGKDTSVAGVISLYGSTDLAALYYHTRQHLTTRSVPGQPKIKVPTKIPAWLIKKMGSEYHRLGMDKAFDNAGALAPLLGGHPDEVPHTYSLLSPITHVHPGCPPTLLLHGEHDILVPVKTTRRLYLRLAENKVPAVMHILPQTDHGFDLVVPTWSPSAHNALHDVERFLALLQRKKDLQKDQSRPAQSYSQQQAGITSL